MKKAPDFGLSDSLSHNRSREYNIDKKDNLPLVQSRLGRCASPCGCSSSNGGYWSVRGSSSSKRGALVIQTCQTQKRKILRYAMRNGKSGRKDLRRKETTSDDTILHPDSSALQWILGWDSYAFHLTSDQVAYSCLRLFCTQMMVTQAHTPAQINGTVQPTT